MDRESSGRLQSAGCHLLVGNSRVATLAFRVLSAGKLTADTKFAMSRSMFVKLAAVVAWDTLFRATIAAGDGLMYEWQHHSATSVDS